MALSLESEIDQKLLNVRLGALTSVIIAIVINVISFYIPSAFDQTEDSTSRNVSIQILIIIMTITVIVFVTVIFILIQFGGIKTNNFKSITASIVYDAKTGELTHYPDTLPQSLVRQVVNASEKYDKNIRERIIHAAKIEFGKIERTILIDFAELLALYQISSLLTLAPQELLKCAKQITKLPLGLDDNTVISIIKEHRNDRDLYLATGNTTNFLMPEGYSISVVRQPRYDHPEFRRMTLFDAYSKITINYHVGGLRLLNSMQPGGPSPEVGGIPVPPYYKEDMMTRFLESGLISARFHYDVKSEVRFSRLILFIIMIGLWPINSSIRRSIALIDFIMQGIVTPHYGSIDTTDFEIKEREYLKEKFIVETLLRLRSYLDKKEKSDNDASIDNSDTKADSDNADNH